MIRLIRTFLAVFVVAARRLWATRWLTLAGGLGFMAAVALAFSVPIYADAVYHRILTRELGITEPGSVSLAPFAFMFRFNMYWQEPAEWADIKPSDQFMEGRVPGLVGLPRTDFLRYFQTTNLRMFSLTDKRAFEQREPLLSIPIVAISDIGAHVRLLDGKMPPEQPASDGDTGVLVSKLMADRLGVQVGDKYVLFTGLEDRGAVRLPVVVAGVWEPIDRYESYWFYRPDLLDIMLLTTDISFTRHVAPLIGKNLSEALWYMDFNGDSVRVWNVPQLLGRIDGLVAAAKAEKVNVSLSASPQDALLRYQRDSRALTLQLYAFSVPLFVLVLAFVILVAGLNVNGQRNEIAVLRSRGASAWQVFAISLLASIVLGVLALGAGAGTALGIAALMGQARSFLLFVGGDFLPVTVTQTSLPFGLGAMGVTVIVTVLPVIGAAQHTIITYKQERARSLRPPWWQRAWLDVLLIIPAAYWTYLLVKQGTVDLPGIGTTGADPFGNPSLFLVPALAMFALTLFLIRLLPLFLHLLSWLLGRLPGTALVLATRQLARSPGMYASPMLLLVLTLALATFTASIATTLDRHMDQQVRYSVGGDVMLVGTGKRADAAAATSTAGFGANKIGLLDTGDSSSAGISAEALKQSETEGPRYLFLPISDYMKVDGVQAATRVGHYPVTLRFSVGGNAEGHILGVDRSDYANIAYWRDDFAGQPLGALMNALASTPDGVLVPEQVLAERALGIGDSLPVNIRLSEAGVDLTLRIVGSFKLWPSWYPNKKDEGSLVVANLDYIFDNAGGQSQYDIWIKVKRSANPATVVEAARQVDEGTWGSYDVRTLIEREQTRPERQGLFGMLSIGFLAAALLTVLGFFLYAVFSYRRRFIELGVLRAIGLSAPQMALALAWEMVLQLGVGVAAGTLLGLWASNLYIPFLQVGATDEARTLPFIVITDWSAVYGVYILFGVLFLVAIAALVAFLSRIKIFQAVKLGETE